jgi:Flp pilus assembly CpaE family ATPase
MRIGAIASEELARSLQDAVAPFDVVVDWWGITSPGLPMGTHEVDGVVVELSELLWGNEALSALTLGHLPVAGLVTSEASRQVAEDLGISVLVSEQHHLAAWLEGLSHTGGNRAPGEATRAGSVVAVWGPTGSPGTTSMVLGLAGLLSQSNTKVIVVDADTAGASIALMLNLPHQASGVVAASRMARVETITAKALLACAVEYEGHRSRFLVLSGLLAPEKFADIELTAFTRVLQVLKDDGHTLVVDLAGPLEHYAHEVIGGPIRDGVQRAVVEMADHIVVVTKPTPTHTARLVRSWSVLTSLAPTTPMTVLCNGVQSPRAPDFDEVKFALWTLAGIEEVVPIPIDSVSLTRAESESATIVDVPQKSPILEALRPVVGALGGQTTRKPVVKVRGKSTRRGISTLWKKPAREGLP